MAHLAPIMIPRFRADLLPQVKPAEAIALQQQLAGRVEREDRLGSARCRP